ncbi:Signal transduction histidine kinase containing PAS domain [Methanonatronarchaeum thermophilum]|uniref:histidine kinase n=1 Tax=Methanonatronarchaeum thermophilum TaxID=1927129 RepID=A0A1Y3GA37_9EURY|nr:PAS domain-containing sensor histidine kinase [Methanonatronarchaeum thermophilum]OUJ18288.1 Signal transduction histidine kinase containing PAS domain [Methanonatronarchaeum thermophilum]
MTLLDSLKQNKNKIKNTIVVLLIITVLITSFYVELVYIGLIALALTIILALTYGLIGGIAGAITSIITIYISSSLHGYLSIEQVVNSLLILMAIGIGIGWAKDTLEEREKEIRETKKKYEKLASEKSILLDNINTHIWYLKNPDTYGLVNNPHAKFHGYKKKQIENKKITEILNKKEAEKIIKDNKKVFQSKKPLKTKHWLTNKKGEKKLFSIKKTPKTKQNKVEYVVCTANDITDKKRTRQREKFLHSLLRHDVRNKSQIIYGYIDILKNQKHPKKTQKYINKTHKAIQEQIEIIDKVRALQKIDQHQKTEINITKTIQKTINQNKDLAEQKNIQIKTKTPKKQIKALGGPLITELLNNIIENAIKHSNATQIKIKTQNQNNQTKITIEDNGKGIPDKQKQKIFKKGYTTNGTGLGLYIAKTIANEYQGNIKLTDSKLGGAKFQITLPSN